MRQVSPSEDSSEDSASKIGTSCHEGHNRPCMKHRDFQGTASRFIKSLGRGHLTPDHVCSWGHSLAASQQMRSLRPLFRGWQTPDPDSLTKDFDADALRQILKKLEQFSAEEEIDQISTSPTSHFDFGTCSTVSPSMATSSARWQDPGETVIMLNWDDTIFPTTWLESKEAFRAWETRRCEKSLTRDEEVLLNLSTPDQEELDYLDHAARSMLLSAAALGRVSCVTLARSPWQQKTMKRWLPLLAQVWEDLSIPVYYAGEEKANLRRGASGVFVKRTRKRAMQKFLTETCGDSWKNVISIGDGPHEFDAMIDLSSEHLNPTSTVTGIEKPLRVKTVGMLERPDCAALTLELQLLQAWLPAIAGIKDDFHVVVPASEDEMLTMHQRFMND